MNGLFILTKFWKKNLVSLDIKLIKFFFREINLELIKTLNNSNSDFYLSQSGIGSDINIFGEWDGPKNYWDVTKKKICNLHFDHPFHCLQNHMLDTENALHIYSCGSYFTAAKLFCKKNKIKYFIIS